MTIFKPELNHYRQNVRKPRIALYLAAWIGLAFVTVGCGPSGEEKVRDACRKLTMVYDSLTPNCDRMVDGNGLPTDKGMECFSLMTKSVVDMAKLDCDKYEE